MIGVQDLTAQLNVMQRTLAQLERRLQRVEEREPARITTDRSHIVRIQGVCGGRPIIDGTRISVKTVVGWVRLGMSPQEIIEQYSLLSAAQVADALAYFEDHPEEIDAQFAEEQRVLALEIPHMQQMVTNRSMRALSPRPFPLDIVVRTPEEIRERLVLGDPFVKEITTQGKVVYERPGS